MQGKLKEGTGWAEFKLQYDAIVFRPFKGEVLECVVKEVNKFGFFAECGPQQVFVSELVRVRLSNCLHTPRPLFASASWPLGRAHTPISKLKGWGEDWAIGVQDLGALLMGVCQGRQW
jgi:hypothetical protein